MKEFGKMWKINRNFYLAALVIILLLAVWDSVYIGNDERFAFTGKSAKQMITETLDSQKEGATVRLADLTLVVHSKMYGGTLFDMTITFVGIILLLFAKYFAYADRRTREFQQTWPVCMWKKNLFDYVAMLLLIVIGWGTETVILLIAGNHYNNEVMRVLTERSLDTSAVGSLAVKNMDFVLVMSVYLLYLILFYTFLYMGMTAAKNPLVGIPVCFIWYTMLFACLEHLETWMWLKDVGDAEFITDEMISGSTWFVTGLWSLLCSQGLYESIDSYGFKASDGYYHIGNISNIAGVLIYVSLIVLMILFTVYISKKKDLSCGKILYSRLADTVLFVCLVFMLCIGVAYISNGYMGFISGVLFLIATFAYRWFKRTKKYPKWEVK